MKRSRSASPPVGKSSLPKLEQPKRASTPTYSLLNRPSTPTTSNCLCHVHPLETQKFINFTKTTWNTFHSAADTRKDPIAIGMKDKWSDGPTGGYHKRCYTTYIQTNRNLPGSVFTPVQGSGKTEIAHTIKEAIGIPEKKVLRQETVKLCKGVCIVCGKDGRKKVKKQGIWIYEKVELCRTKEAGENFARAAKSRNEWDKAAALAIGGDAVAADISWHMSCYRDYVYHAPAKDSAKTSTKTESSAQENQYEKAYSRLCSEVHEELFTKGKVWELIEIRNRYIVLLKEEGVDSPNYTTQKMKNRIQKTFGDSIESGYKTTTKAEYIFSSSFTKAQIIEVGLQKLEHEEEDEMLSTAAVPMGPSEPSNILFLGAKLLRSELREQESNIPKLPTSVNISENNIIIPNDVYNFLAWTLTDNSEPSTERVSVSSRDNRLILSIGQDLLYGASGGRTLTPKHVGLPFALRNMTGSSEAVRLVNRFGHGMSYESLIKTETDMDSLLQKENMVHLPINIKSGVRITCVWDNIDFAEETLSGQGTTHKTNGIILQQQVVGCQEAAPRLQIPDDADHVPLPNQVLPYYASERKGLPKAIELHDLDSLSYTCPASDEANMLDNLWFLLRLPLHNGSVFDFSNTVVQTVPGMYQSL